MAPFFGTAQRKILSGSEQGVALLGQLVDATEAITKLGQLRPYRSADQPRTLLHKIIATLNDLTSF